MEKVFYFDFRVFFPKEKEEKELTCRPLFFLFPPKTGVALAPLAAFGAMHASGLLEDDDDDDGSGEAESVVSSSFADGVFGSSSKPFSSSFSPKSAAAAGPALVLAACALSAAAGIPFWALPAPLTAAAGLALFWETRRTRHSLLFAAGALASAAWFASHHFGHLSLPEDASRRASSLSSLAFASVVVAAPAAVLPGLASKAAATEASAGASAAVARFGAGLALLLHASGLAALEQALYCGDHGGGGSSGSGDSSWVSSSSEMYPAYLVVATSVALSAAARALASSSSSSFSSTSSSSSSSSPPRSSPSSSSNNSGALPFFATATKWLCLAKLSILVLPASRPLWPAALWLMSAGPGIAAAFFNLGGSENGDGNDDDNDDERKKDLDARSSRPPPLTKTAAVSLAGLGALSTYHARFLVFEVLEAATGVRPTHASAAGALALSLSLATAPALHAGGLSGAPLALCSALGAAGLAVLVLEPPLPASALGESCSLGVLCPASLLRWDQRHTPETAFSSSSFSSSSSSSAVPDDISVWGDLGLSGREGGRYPSWLLVGAAATGAAAAAVGGFGRNRRHSRGKRRGFLSAVVSFFSGASSVSLAATAAAAVGAFVAGEAFPSSGGKGGSGGGILPGLASRAALHLSVLGSAVALALCTLLVRSRSRSAGGALRGALLPWVGALASAAAALSSKPAAAAGAAGAAGAMAKTETVWQPLRLFPDAMSAAARDADAVEASTLAGIAAAECLLLALACKLRVSVEVRKEREVVVGGSGGGDDSSLSRHSRSPGFAAAAACSRGANMRFLPSLSNALTLCGYALAVLSGALASAASLGSSSGGEGETGKQLGDLSAAARSAALLSPALLLLCPDPRLFRNLSSPRRHAPPALSAALSCALATMFSLARDSAVRKRMVSGFPGATFAGTGDGEEEKGPFASLFLGGGAGSSPGVYGDSLKETALVLAALPAHLLLFAHLWAKGEKGRERGGNGNGRGLGSSSSGGVTVAALLVLSLPLSVLSLAAGRCSSTKWLAAGALAALAVVAAQRALSGGGGSSRRVAAAKRRPR